MLDKVMLVLPSVLRRIELDYSPLRGPYLFRKRIPEKNPYLFDEADNNNVCRDVTKHKQWTAVGCFSSIAQLCSQKIIYRKIIRSSR